MSPNNQVAAESEQVSSTQEDFFLYRWGWRHWVLATAVVFCTWSVGANVWYWFGPNAWGPRLSCREPSTNLGKASPGEVVEHVFVLANTGAADVTILKVIPACNCTITRMDGVSIPSGHEVTMPVRVQMGKRAGPFRKTLVVESNAVQEPHLVLSLRGEIVADATGDQ